MSSWQVATYALDTAGTVEWRNTSTAAPPPTLPSTWDYDPTRELWRRRRDGMVVSTTEILRARCANIIAYEQRFLRTSAPSPGSTVRVSTPDGQIPVSAVAQLSRRPPGTHIAVTQGREEEDDLGPCMICDKDVCECVWTTRDGSRIPVVEMDDGHLWNAIRARSRRGGIDLDHRYRPLIREARRRGWYGGVPPLPVGGVARPDPIPDEEPRVKREPYQQGKRLIKI